MKSQHMDPQSSLYFESGPVRAVHKRAQNNWPKGGIPFTIIWYFYIRHFSASLLFGGSKRVLPALEGSLFNPSGSNRSLFNPFRKGLTFYKREVTIDDDCR